MDKHIEKESSQEPADCEMSSANAAYSNFVLKKQIKQEPLEADWHEVAVNVSDTVFVKIEAGDISSHVEHRHNVDAAAVTDCSMEIVPTKLIKNECLKSEYQREGHKFNPEICQAPTAMYKSMKPKLRIENADSVESEILLETEIKQEPLDGSKDRADDSNLIIVEIERRDDNLEEKHQMNSHVEAPAAVSTVKWQPSDMYNTANSGPAVKSSTVLYKYSCNHCNYKCMYASNLKFHMMTHTGEKPFACKHCDYKCSQSSFLKRHMRIHTGEKPFSCEHCGYKCSQARDLKIHILNHSGVKEFNCDYCDYKCSQASHLTRHVRTHTGVKPYSCDRCDYKCSQADNLKRHLRTHTGEKPFKCEQCNYKCRQAGHLKRHLKMHIDGKALSCDYCDYKCKRVDSMDRHLSTHIGEKT